MGINLGAALSGFQAGIDPIIKTRLQERAQRNLMQLEQQHKLEAGEVEARQRLEQAQALQRETLGFQSAENKAGLMAGRVADVLGRIDRDLQSEDRRSMWSDDVIDAGSDEYGGSNKDRV